MEPPEPFVDAVDQHVGGAPARRFERDERVGDDEWRAASARCALDERCVVDSPSRKKPSDEITCSVRPSRPSARSRRLPRTESPTINAPARTATAAATPSITAELVRQ